MRVGHVVGVLALLAGTPAMAQVVVTTPAAPASGYHQDRADESREAAHQDMRAAHANAAVGNYGAAAADQQAARENRHVAHHEEHQVMRDSSGNVIVLRQ